MSEGIGSANGADRRLLCARKPPLFISVRVGEAELDAVLAITNRRYLQAKNGY